MESTLNSVEFSFPFTPTVKNTFVHMTEEQAPRRCSSVPPSARLNGFNADNVDQFLAECRLSQGTSWADASTDTGRSEDDVDSVVSSSSSKPGMLTLSAKHSNNWSQVQDSRTRLRSSAQAWTPHFRAVDHRSQFLEVISAAAMALDLSGVLATNTAIKEINEGWTIIAHVASANLRSKDLAEPCAVAQAHLLSAAAKSQNIFILGYCLRPFMPQTWGFSARLGAMLDENQACWGLFQRGYCTRGCSCQWQHPQQQAIVRVEFKNVQN